METQLELAELLERLRWFIKLRWLAASGIVLATVLSRYILNIGIESIPLFVIAALVAGYNAVLLVCIRIVRNRTQKIRRAKLAANVQIALDLIALTAILHFAGGISNPFFIYYVFHIIIASILLSPGETFFQAGFAIFALWAMAVAELDGLIPHVPVRGVFDGDEFSQLDYVLAVMVAFGSAIVISAVVGTSIVAKLRAREAEITRLNDSLEQRTVEVEASYEQLRQIESLKSQYMRKASHELRAPLATVETILTVVRDGFVGQIPDQPRDLLERASVRVRELQGIVNDLMVLSRTKDLSCRLESQPVDVREEIENVISQFRIDADGKGVELLSNVPQDMPSYCGDREALHDLLTNLVSNAVRYTGTGGTVLVCADRNSDSLHLIVSDTGIGIDRDCLCKVFDEFYRTKQAREMVKDGTGLGLAIVKAVVESHKGFIQVESEPGVGTTFSVTLPVKEASGRVSDRSMPLAANVGAKSAKRGETANSKSEL